MNTNKTGFNITFDTKTAHLRIPRSYPSYFAYDDEEEMRI